uniref:Uncharacterized protein n=1 Tax=Tetranychus urticae TaxID=32264 RepID=T1JPR5_TETUR
MKIYYELKHLNQILDYYPFHCLKMFNYLSILLIRFTCVTLFLAQFIILTQRLLEFNVVHEIDTFVSEDIEVPEINIQIPYQYVMDKKILRSKLGPRFEAGCKAASSIQDYDVKHDIGDCDLFKTDPQVFSRYIGMHLTLDEIARYTYPNERLIYGFNSIDVIEENFLTNGGCQINRKASAFYLELVINCSNSTLKLERTQSLMLSNYLFSFYINTSFMQLNLNQPGEPQIDAVSHPEHSSTSSGKRASNFIHYNRIFRNLLPSPYRTYCKEYSQYKEYEDCVHTNSLNQTGSLYPLIGVPIEKYSNKRDLRFYINFENNILADIHKKCRQQTSQPMCSSIQYSFHYSFVMDRNLIDTKPGRENIKLTFLLSPKPDSVAKSRPDLSVLDYLILSGSLFSTWFGISIVGQLMVIHRTVGLIIDKHKNQQNVNPSN